MNIQQILQKTCQNSDLACYSKELTKAALPPLAVVGGALLTGAIGAYLWIRSERNYCWNKDVREHCQSIRKKELTCNAFVLTIGAIATAVLAIQTVALTVASAVAFGGIWCTVAAAVCLNHLVHQKALPQKNDPGLALK